MGELLDNILDYSKIDDHKLMLHRQPGALAKAGRETRISIRWSTREGAGELFV